MLLRAEMKGHSITSEGVLNWWREDNYYLATLRGRQSLKVYKLSSLIELIRLLEKYNIKI
jgi:hypothetical protein